MDYNKFLRWFNSSDGISLKKTYFKMLFHDNRSEASFHNMMNYLGIDPLLHNGEVIYKHGDHCEIQDKFINDLFQETRKGLLSLSDKDRIILQKYNSKNIFMSPTTYRFYIDHRDLDD